MRGRAMILAADVGGTNTRVALFDADDVRHAAVEVTVASRAHDSLESILRPFLTAHASSVDAVGIAAAGPVRDGCCETTNLPWVIDATLLGRDIGTDRVWLVNDLEATAHGIGSLGPEDFAVLNAGVPHPGGNAAVIAAGTGLGEAGLYWSGERYQPFASEGGHTSFSPRDARESDLLAYLRRNWSHVSWERVLSGPGLLNLYRFLRDSGGIEEPPWLANALGAGDPAAVISEAARQRRVALCEQTMDLFVSLYGAEAGNLALKLLATGGVYVAGGIAPRNIARMTDGTFMRAFVAKGRMGPLLERIPVRVIINDKTALLGAARVAAERGRLV